MMMVAFTPSTPTGKSIALQGMSLDSIVVNNLEGTTSDEQDDRTANAITLFDE